MNRRLGKFLIPLRLIEKDPEAVAELFAEARCVVVASLYRYDLSSMEYTALSNQFNRIDVGEEAPHYGVLTTLQRIVRKLDGGKLNVKSVTILHFLGMGEPDVFETMPVISYEERKEESREETKKDFPPEPGPCEIGP